MLKKFILGIVIFVFAFCMQTNQIYALTPASDLTYEGIDVSNWQGYINYAEVRNAGIQVVYIKASQGTILSFFNSYEYRTSTRRSQFFCFRYFWKNTRL